MFNEMGSLVMANIQEVRLLILLPVLSVLYLLWDRVWFNKTPYEWAIELDRKIPIIPWTVIIYNSWYPSMLLIYFFLALDHKMVFRQLIAAYLLIHIVSFLFYMFFQNKVVRHEIPGNGFTVWFLKLTRHANNPYNGCPSVHVSTCTLTMISAMVSGFSPAVKMIILILETAIIISTLTTEQHVIVDVIWGIVLGIVGWLLTGLMFV